ncbi:MAG: cytochrome c oxidase subunit II [Gemmobacter sp.]
MAGCGGPLSTLDPAGPSAALIAGLWWAMLAGSALVTVLVLALVWAAFRGFGRTAADRVWTLWLGIGFTLSVLTVLLAYALWVGERILPRDDGALRVAAHARQWGWEFTQPGPGGNPVRTRDVLFVPAGQPFDIEVTSEDVIHSFWVPRLGGKMDAIPGRVNVKRLTADAPGRLDGLCAEFCGVGHAAMRFSVVVYDPADGPAIDPVLILPETAVELRR